MASATPHTAPGRRERRRREIHERILQAAITLFARKGFAMTTALEIAEAADVAEKTFYNHFATKQLLVQELAQQALHNTGQRITEMQKHPGTTAERLSLLCERSAADSHEGSREFTREVLLEVLRTAQFDDAGREHSRQLNVAIRALLEEGLARGDVAPDRDIASLADLWVATYLGILVQWVSLPNYPLHDRMRQLGEIGAEWLGRPGKTPQNEVVR